MLLFKFALVQDQMFNCSRHTCSFFLGKGRKTAMWATNVGNEHGQVLVSVLTVGEGIGLKQMIDGLIQRYAHASVSPPKVLYTDRDCCGSSSVLKYFDAWPFLHVR